jgi:hypothetical protein
VGKIELVSVEPLCLLRGTTNEPSTEARLQETKDKLKSHNDFDSAAERWSCFLVRAPAYGNRRFDSDHNWRSVVGVPEVTSSTL